MINNKPLTILCMAVGLSLSACASHTRTASVTPTSGNLARLMAMPDAEMARAKAPIFTRDALETVNELETQLKEEKAK